MHFNPCSKGLVTCLQVTKRAPDKTAVGEDEAEDTGGGEANLSVSLSAKTPLQLTLTKTSLELLKSLVKVNTLSAMPQLLSIVHDYYIRTHRL